VPLDAKAVAARITNDVSRDTDSMLKAPPASTVSWDGPPRQVGEGRAYLVAGRAAGL